MKHWVIPCKVSDYDIFSAFDNLKEIPWRTNAKMKIGDLVYIYLSSPYKYIAYKCEVTNIDVPFNNCPIDDFKYRINLGYKKEISYTILKLIKEYDECDITFNNIKKWGWNFKFQGPAILPDYIERYILKFD